MQHPLSSMRQISAVQVLCAAVAIAAGLLVCAYPPYSDDAGLIGGTAYDIKEPFASAPKGPSIRFDDGLFRFEWTFILLWLVASQIAFRRNASVWQRRKFVAGLAAEAGLLWWGLPQLDIILAPEVTTGLLNIAALLVLIILWRVRPLGETL